MSHLQKVNKSKQIMLVRKFAGLLFAEVIYDLPPLASIQEYLNNLKQTNKPQIWKNFEHIYTQYCAAVACGIACIGKWINTVCDVRQGYLESVFAFSHLI